MLSKNRTTSALPTLSGLVRIVHHLTNCPRDGGRIVGRDDPAARLLPDEVGLAWVIRDDHRHPAGERLVDLQRVDASGGSPRQGALHAQHGHGTANDRRYLTIRHFTDVDDAIARSR